MSKKRKTTDGKIELGGVASIDSTKFRTPAKRGTQYQAVLDRMVGLKPEQMFTIKCPPGVESRDMHNRVNAVLRRSEIKPPAGTRFEKRTTEAGDVAICLVKDDGTKPRPGRKPGKK